MDYSNLIDELIRSYTSQIELYRKLEIVVQKIIGQVAVSRGDYSSVMRLFEEKQKLVRSIEAEREQVKGSRELWQKEKELVPETGGCLKLDSVLAEAEEVIREFLEAEEQLKTYLEHNISAAGNTAKP